MTSVAKILIPGKEWLITNNKEKIGSVARATKGFVFMRKGENLNFQYLTEINKQFSINILEDSSLTMNIDQPSVDNFSIYDYPCSSKPFDPVYSVKEKLPLYTKSNKSVSQYCAGYYLIQFKKGWVKSFCPKLITLERYPFQGPYKTTSSLKTALTILNKASKQ